MECKFKCQYLRIGDSVSEIQRNLHLSCYIYIVYILLYIDMLVYMSQML